VEETIRALGETELAAVRATESAALAELTEDELLDLHTRVRRARNKYVGQYRRRASARVAEAGARGAVRPGNRRAAERAEVFEAALARVSTALARSARQSAAQLKSERLAAARADRAGVRPATPPDAQEVASPAPTRPPVKSAGRRKRDASTLAAGARRQARRDSR
jgi:hypothetical protein